MLPQKFIGSFFLLALTLLNSIHAASVERAKSIPQATQSCPELRGLKKEKDLLRLANGMLKFNQNFINTLTSLQQEKSKPIRPLIYSLNALAQNQSHLFNQLRETLKQLRKEETQEKNSLPLEKIRNEYQEKVKQQHKIFSPQFKKYTLANRGMLMITYQNNLNALTKKYEKKMKACKSNPHQTAIQLNQITEKYLKIRIQTYQNTLGHIRAHQEALHQTLTENLPYLKDPKLSSIFNTRAKASKRFAKKLHHLPILSNRLPQNVPLIPILFWQSPTYKILLYVSVTLFIGLDLFFLQHLLYLFFPKGKKKLSRKSTSKKRKRIRRKKIKINRKPRNSLSVKQSLSHYFPKGLHLLERLTHAFPSL